MSDTAKVERSVPLEISARPQKRPQSVLPTASIIRVLAIKRRANGIRQQTTRSILAISNG